MNIRQAKIRKCLARVLDQFVQGPETNKIEDIQRVTEEVLTKFGRGSLLLFKVENDPLDGAFIKILPLNEYTSRLLGDSVDISKWKSDRKRSIHIYMEMEISALMNKAERLLTKEEFSKWLSAVSEEIRSYRKKKPPHYKEEG